MKINLTKTEKAISIATFVGVSIFFASFIRVSQGVKSTSHFETADVIDYTMARPDQIYSEYTLNGREFDRSFEGVPVEKSEINLNKKKQDLITKKVTDIKKKEEIKKKQALAAKNPQRQAAAKLQEQQLNAQLNSKLNAPSIYTKNNFKKDSTVRFAQNNPLPVYAVNSPNNVDAEAIQQEIKSNKKTVIEWKNILFSKPTTESLSLFIAAFRKNEVTGDEYQLMSQDLIAQNDIQLKGLGLMALRSVPSLPSLAQLVHLETANLGGLQSYVEQSLNAYLQAQNIQYINQALLTKDKKLVLGSLALLSINLTNFELGDFSSIQDPRNRRDGEVLSISMASFKSLLPALVQLGLSPDQEVARLAQQLTPLIQSSPAVAQN